MRLRQATSYEQYQWLRYKRDNDDPGLTLSYQFKLVGDIDIRRLDHTLKMVVSGHFCSLLCYFFERDNKIYVGENVLPEKMLEQVCNENLFASNSKIVPSGDKLYRFSYFCKDLGVVLIRLEFSHLVFDGTCYEYFLQLFSSYWQDGFSPSETLLSVDMTGLGLGSSTIDYWRKTLNDARLYQNLPFCYKKNQAAAEYLSVKKTLNELDFFPISELLESRNITLFQFVVAVTAATISRYDHSDDDEGRVVLAYSVNSRPERAAYGCYTNILPMFVHVDCSQPGANLLEEVKRKREDVRVHQHAPTLQLLEMADVRASHGGSLFNLLVNCSDGLVPYEVPVMEGVEVEWMEKPNTGGPSDLAINYSSDGQKLYVSFDSSSRCISTEALAALAENFVRMASFIALSTDVPLSGCDLSRSLKPVVCGPKYPITADDNVIAKFVVAASRFQNEIAVSDEITTLTYQDVLQAVNALSSSIRLNPRVTGTSSIGVFLRRSTALPIAYLSVLSIQRAFVPMDPLLPNDRLQYIVDAAQVEILLVDQHTRERAVACFPEAILIMVDEAILAKNVVAQDRTLRSLSVSNMSAHTDRTAYIMFTSGSTGNPKGVEVSEHNLANFLCAMEASPGFTAGDRLLALTPVSFDISILELLLPLVCGGYLHIVSDKTRMSASLLGKAINHHDVSVVQATPSTWRILQQSGWRAAHPFKALCGGEALDAGVAEYLLQQTGLLYNMYGPTEATIWASLRRIVDAENINLGLPVLNSDYYILGPDGKSVSPGMQGELVIAGACVGRGYLNAASEQVFVTIHPEKKAYKTGDVVRYHSRLNIEYVGRRDSQHKINGYRVDTAEITYRFKEFEPAATVFTVIRSKPEPHLCCFLWLPDGSDFDETEAVKWCQRMLPYYMVPRVIRHLSMIPLTPNGKANLKMLSTADMAELPLRTTPQQRSRSTVSTRAEVGIQCVIQTILREKLDLSVIDLDQPLGWMGLNSISYNVLSTEINLHFDIQFQSFEFYEYSSINEIAGVICQRMTQETGGNKAKSIASCHKKNDQDTRLAIVGLSVMLPGGNDAEAFWNGLLEKVNYIIPAPPQRDMRGYSAGFLPNVKGFDARFFSISPLEAMRMDPRQRLLMQSAWRTLENAGYAPFDLAGERTGCYMAATGLDYALLQARCDEKQTPYSLSGHSLSMLANRLSSYFDWTGPSFTLDTACSGALTALVKACRDLRAQVCDSAMVGGINLILDPQINKGLSAGRFMSSDKRCATFDESANGYVRGEGYGCFFVKRFSDAVADGDHIHAVIESAVENHGGKANSLTAPNSNAQYRLYLDAYTPELAQRVSYIETHGTGTRLGDPIEIAAIKRAWCELVDPEKENRIWLGAVKTNIGHLEPAAGIASVTKIIKAFEHQMLPANLHFNALNPDIDLEASSFRILSEATPWNADTPLTAGVSSFGFGGANAHVVLSAAEQGSPTITPSYDFYLVPVSARTEQALNNNIEALARYIEHRRGHSTMESDLLHLSYTLSCGRAHFDYRQAWIVSSIDDLLAQLRAHRKGVHTPRRRHVEDAAIDYIGLGDGNTLQQMHSDYLDGVIIDWRRLYCESGARRMPLPTYSFDEREYWFTKGKVDLLHTSS